MRYAGEPAYVLHARPWRETSVLVEVLTGAYGRLGLLARGVQGPKRHPLKAALAPLQSIRFDAVQRGELARLVTAEAVDTAPVLEGDALLCGFYLNELTLRLAPRQDPQPELFNAYGRTRALLGAGAPLSWTLRRYERDLLDALGVGFDWAHDAQGAALDPASRYRVDPEAGLLRVLLDRGAADRSRHASGRGLLALAADAEPPAEDLPGLRRVLRDAVDVHLGGRGLNSRDMLATLGRISRGD